MGEVTNLLNLTWNSIHTNKKHLFIFSSLLFWKMSITQCIFIQKPKYIKLWIASTAGGNSQWDFKWWKNSHFSEYLCALGSNVQIQLSDPLLLLRFTLHKLRFRIWLIYSFRGGLNHKNNIMVLQLCGHLQYTSQYFIILRKAKY